MSWQPGDRLTHALNAEIGAGEVIGIDGRFVVVHFPKVERTLRLAAASDALEPLVFGPGSLVHHQPSDSHTTVDEILDDGSIRLRDGQLVEATELWPDDVVGRLLERLSAGKVDSQESFALRLDVLRLAAIREADGLGSFLGGRIQLFPHQLYVAERATRSDPVRWLLADEVGLGKTVESCLILNHLLRTGRADQTLIVAPETLTVQWLGELWRKYHRVFVLLDEKRLLDVEKDFGKGFNPFDAHDRVVVSEEFLVSTPRLVEQAIEASIDLVVVDEAHHLRRRPGHPGNASYRSIAPIVAAARHALLLSAVPLEDDAHGFFRLLQLLRPEEFKDSADFESRLGDGLQLPACTSSTRRSDIGGLPPRVGVPIDLADDEAWAAQMALLDWLRDRPADGKPRRMAKALSIRRALASPSLLTTGSAKKEETEMRELAATAEACDPRLEWLLDSARAWQRQGDKTLVFVAERDLLETLRESLNRKQGLRVGAFHEDMSAKQRDIEVAQFRLPGGPSMLISTECGGEGRNFEFCTRLVLFDMPWNPIVVEQRVGRLDRIGRRSPVEIVYFKPPRGLGAVVTGLYERLGIFKRPLGSLELDSRRLSEAIEELALSEGPVSDNRALDDLEKLAEQADRVQNAAYSELHREPYSARMAAGILARVPPDLEELTRDVVLAACRDFGLQVEEHDAGKRHWIELDARARIDSLPGLGAKASFLGTFYREEALADETIDYFASGHPLVEGLLQFLEDARLGRVAMLDISNKRGARQLGLLAIFREGAGFKAEAYDSKGRERVEWRDRLLRRPLESRPVRAKRWAEQAAWPRLIRVLAQAVDGRDPEAVAAFRAD